jgi:hypothetical protein
VQGPDDQRWEVYTVLADANETDLSGDGLCCGSGTDEAVPLSVRSAPCC